MKRSVVCLMFSFSSRLTLPIILVTWAISASRENSLTDGLKRPEVAGSSQRGEWVLGVLNLRGKRLGEQSMEGDDSLSMCIK